MSTPVTPVSARSAPPAGGPPASEGLRQLAPIRNALIAAVGLCIVVAAFFASYSAGFGQPAVRDLTIASSAPARATASLDSSAVIHVRPVSDAAAARQAVLDRHVDGAIAAGPHGRLTVYIADGGGRSDAVAVTGLGQQLGSRLGVPVTVEDVAPLAPGDPTGSIEFYCIVFLTIGAGLGVTVLGRILTPVRRPVELLERVITLVAYSALPAAIVTGLADGLFHALIGRPGPVFLVLWAYVFAVACAVAGVALAFGPVASIAVILFLVVVGNPASGGPAAPALLPAFFRVLGPGIPQGGGVWLLRSVLYFGGDGGLARGVVCLLAWGAGGLLLAGLAVGRHAITRRRIQAISAPQA